MEFKNNFRDSLFVLKFVGFKLSYENRLRDWIFKILAFLATAMQIFVCVVSILYVEKHINDIMLIIDTTTLSLSILCIFLKMVRFYVSLNGLKKLVENVIENSDSIINEREKTT